MNLTAAQQNAVEARGNVLVSAAAGTGKTGTLVARCLRCLREEQPRASLDELLVVTFTEAAAAEMRERLRSAVERELQQSPGDAHWQEQLVLFDAANIGTLHSFCFRLARRHFYELNLDPQLSVLDQGEARLLADESIQAVLERHYAGPDAAAEQVRQLVLNYGGGRGDRAIRALILRLHDYLQTRPDPSAWLESQLKMFATPEPDLWRQWLREAMANWREESKSLLERLAAGNEKAVECLAHLRAVPRDFNREQIGDCLAALQKSATAWPKGRKTVLKKPLEDFFEAVDFFSSLLVAAPGGMDPLVEDWHWTRGHLTALLELAREFDEHYRRAKHEAGVADFHDLEQFALQLLWDFKANRPTRLAERWRSKIRFVFVDEYQDINAAQDKIIEALSREPFGVPPSGGSEPPEGGTPNNRGEGNRFLVGDVKQSIYRFRLADPAIFAGYEKTWRGDAGRTLSLVENFRSREGILKFINEFFAGLMRPELGGVDYDAAAQLQFGAPQERRLLGLAANPAPRVELLLRLKGKSGANAEATDAPDPVSDLLDAEQEARLLALRLKELKTARHEIWDAGQKKFRAAEWRDMAVLLRAPSGKAEGYAMAFAQVGVPLAVERGGFYDGSEVADLLNLLKLLDNPLQDIPAIAVLRSPLVGLSLAELAAIRLAQPGGSFWTALIEWQKAESGNPEDARRKTQTFLDRHAKWRRLARQVSLSRCLEAILTETHYEDWLQGQPGGRQRRANLRQFIAVARKFDAFQRQGLFRFLRFVEAQQESETEPETAAANDENAVRLLSIHRSKGLEFPIVAVADLGKPFNVSDLNADLILDEQFGLGPQIKPPQSVLRYPSLPYWLARRRRMRELLGEELRLLYVAMTRAEDTLILTGGISEKKWTTQWNGDADAADAAASTARSYADWLAAWFARHCAGGAGTSNHGETPFARWTLHGETDSSTGESTAIEGESPLAGKTLDAAAWRRLQPRLEWEYPFAPATRKAAKASVSTLRRQANEETDEEAESLPHSKFGDRQSKFRPRPASAPSAADIGLVHHRFMQFVSLAQLDGIDGLRREAGRMERERLLAAGESALLDLEGIAAFWRSDFGRKVAAEPTSVRRELPFTLRCSPVELARITGEPADPALGSEFVVVQGIADLAVILRNEIWLADFKTDQVNSEELQEKSAVYAPQLKLYALALSRIYQRPVTECCLFFISPRATVRIEA